MLWRMWESLNQHIDPEDASYSDARRRALAHLGDYAAQIVGPLNLRPRAAALHSSSNTRIEARISTASSHILLVLAPEGDLAAEVAWLRALNSTTLPVPRLITHDLSLGTIPFSYTIESYVSGAPLDWVAEAPRVRVLARQVGRTLRRSHQVAAAGFGRPAVSGRWPSRTWPEALRAWLGDLWPRAVEVLGAAGAAALAAATIDHPSLECARAQVLHGAVAPHRALVTVGETTQLEALTRPGEIVGGDPIFDLAHAVQPHHPEPFRQGVREGYDAMGPIGRVEEARLARLGLLLRAADTLRRANPSEMNALPGAIAGELRQLGV